MSYESNHDRIENDFNFHRADSRKAMDHEHIRNACKALAHRIDTVCPNGREKSTAFTKLEEVMMWANASIARNIPAIPEDQEEIRDALSK